MGPVMRSTTVLTIVISEKQSPNRTDFCRFKFSSLRLYFEKHGSSSVRFDFISKNMVRARFGLTLFWKTWFEFGSLRLYFKSKIESDRTWTMSYNIKHGSSSVRFDCILKAAVRIRFGSVRVLFGSTALWKQRFEFGSVRSDRTLKTAIRVRFGSTLFWRTRFGFGSTTFWK